MNTLHPYYFRGLSDVPYHWEVELAGRVVSGRVVSRPGSFRQAERISAALVSLDISERHGQQNPVAHARLLTELQGT